MEHPMGLAQAQRKTQSSCDTDYATCRSLPDMFFKMAELRKDRPFLWSKQRARYVAIRWSEAAELVTQLANGLAALGIRPGDRVALVSENRPEWVIADLAIMHARAISVPAYVTNTVEDHRHILRNSGACAAIVSTRTLAERVIPAALQAPDMRLVVLIDPSDDAATSIATRSYQEVLAL